MNAYKHLNNTVDHLRKIIFHIIDLNYYANGLATPSGSALLLFFDCKIKLYKKTTNNSNVHKIRLNLLEIKFTLL